MTESSLKSRYLYKLSSNLLGLFINIIVQAIVPRGLGPKNYGDFNYLTNFFSQAVSFLEMGTSTCYYTKLSQRQNERSLVGFYLLFALVVSVTLVLFMAGASVIGLHTMIWPDQSLLFVWLAALWALLNWQTTICNSMADAFGLTVASERVRMAQRVVGAVVIVVLYWSSYLNLLTYYLYSCSMFLLLGIVLIKVLTVSGHSPFTGWDLSLKRIREYGKEFYDYSQPLFIISLIGCVVNILDRWLLQLFSGSVQQGFYGLSSQISTICFLFSSAMTPLLTREFSISFTKNDFDEMRRLFMRHVPMLFSISAFFACFVAVESQRVTQIFAGKEFAGAAWVVAIMAMYPIYQTYGQMCGSVFYATGQTALYRNIGVATMLAGTVMTVFFIAPRHYGGLDAGATGLAVKMVMVNAISVNILLYYNAKLLRMNFLRFLGHQVACIAVLLLIATVATRLASKEWLPISSVVGRFLASGTIYTCLVAVLVITTPILFGLKRDDLNRFTVEIKGRLNW